MNRPRSTRASCGPAFIAGVLVTVTHVPLGIQVLSRGIVFIDLAIAQIAGLGVICADCFGFEPQGWAVAGFGAARGAARARCCSHGPRASTGPTCRKR